MAVMGTNSLYEVISNLTEKEKNLILNDQHDIVVLDLFYDPERGNCAKMILDYDSEKYRSQLENYPFSSIIDGCVVFQTDIIIRILKELLEESSEKSNTVKKFQVRQAFARADSQLNGEEILFVELYPINEERGGYSVTLTEWINIVTLLTQNNISHFSGEDEKIVEIDLNDYRKNNATLHTGELITIYQHNDYIDKVISL